MSKWYWIAVGLFLAIMAGGMVLSEYQKSECKMDLAKAGRSVEEIQQICK